LLAPIHGETWGYRQRARLSVRYVAKKGWRARRFSRAEVELRRRHDKCLCCRPRISALLPELRALVGRLSIRDRLPQIELAIGEDDGAAVDALVLRILAPLSATDEEELAASPHAIACNSMCSRKAPPASVLLDPPAAGLRTPCPTSA